MTYICSICHSVNHAAKFQCSVCGTIPAMYSVGRNRSCRQHPCNSIGTETVVARGAVRQAEQHLPRVYLRTVTADYYAEV